MVNCVGRNFVAPNNIEHPNFGEENAQPNEEGRLPSPYNPGFTLRLNTLELSKPVEFHLNMESRIAFDSTKADHNLVSLVVENGPCVNMMKGTNLQESLMFRTRETTERSISSSLLVPLDEIRTQVPESLYLVLRKLNRGLPGSQAVTTFDCHDLKKIEAPKDGVIELPEAHVSLY